MRRSWIATLVSVLTLAAASGVVSAGPASASVNEEICVSTMHSVCAYAHGSNAVEMITQTGTTTNYWLNGANHPPGQIQQADTSMCLQLDHAAGNIVIEAACNGASYQQWQASLSNSGGGLAFSSSWNASLCLTYNESKAILDVVTCNGAWYQSFIPN